MSNTFITAEPMAPTTRRDLERLPENGFFVRDITKPHRVTVITVLAALTVLSGALSTCSLWFQPAGFWLGPGVIFGLLVLLPWCRACQVPWSQTWAIVWLSPCGYAAAVYVFCLGWFPVAGLVACAITFAPLANGCHPRVRSAAMTATLVGCLAGWLFMVWFLAAFGGVALWQIAVGWCLCKALRADDSSNARSPDGQPDDTSFAIPSLALPDSHIMPANNPQGELTRASGRAEIRRLQRRE